MKKEYEFHIDVTLGNSSSYYSEFVKVFVLKDSFPSELEIRLRLYDTLKSNGTIWHPNEVKYYKIINHLESIYNGK